ncbi:MAG: hypothetical protein MI919_12680, partial [Holophagales bacterium]|nr:hypothetical protein [Holophagales bacterium]
SAEILHVAIEEALEVYRLRSVERDMMEKTVKGSINILTDVLSLSNPIAFGRASRVKRLAGAVAGRLGYDHVWEVEIAALLSQVGLVTVPDEILAKADEKQPLTKQEYEVLKGHPGVAQRLVQYIPRLEKIARIIVNQRANYSTTKEDETVLPESHILRAALDYDQFIAENKSPDEAVASMRGQSAAKYDPDVLRTLVEVVAVESDYRRQAVSIIDLRENMIIAEDVRGKSGVILIGKGQEVTYSLRSRLLSYARTAGVVEPLQVYVMDAETEAQ